LMRLAGGVFTDVRGRAVPYNTEATTNRCGLLAARRALLAGAVEAVAAVVPEAPAAAG